MTSLVTIYFHGLPGTHRELELLGPLPEATGGWYFPDRSKAACFPDPFGAMSEEIADRFPGAEFELVGFSLGGSAALRVAARLGKRVRNVHGIAAGAPLQQGNFLSGMAGAPVFRAAQHRWQFTVLSRLQAAMATVSPSLMRRMLFANPRGGDKDLVANPHFQQGMEGMLRLSLALEPAAYRREVPLYVADWTEELSFIDCPVTLWQGDEDDWVPPEMADALVTCLDGNASLHRLPGLSHYSALRHFLSQL